MRMQAVRMHLGHVERDAGWAGSAVEASVEARRTPPGPAALGAAASTRQEQGSEAQAPRSSNRCSKTELWQTVASTMLVSMAAWMEHEHAIRCRHGTCPAL